MKITTTKKALLAILTVSLIDLQLSYILAFLGRDNIAETLAVAIVTEVIGTFAVYCWKSFKETKEEKANELEYFKLNEGKEMEEVDEETQT